MAATQTGAVSKKRKFVADGVFYAELNEFFQRELAEEGYSGVEVRVTPTVTDIIIRATHTQEVLGEQGRRIRELTSLIQKRFKFPENSVSLYAAKVQNRGLSAVAQCESLRYKLLNGLAVRRACYGVLRFIMESGAKGCEVVVSGKLRAARAKSMKFTDGFMIHSGQPAKDFIDSATRHVLLRQGVLGIKVKIMRGSDPEGKAGPQKSLPDSVTIIEPKEEQAVVQPMSQDYGAKAVAAQQAAEQQRYAEQQDQAGDQGGEDYGAQEYSMALAKLMGASGHTSEKKRKIQDISGAEQQDNDEQPPTSRQKVEGLPLPIETAVPRCIDYLLEHPTHRLVFTPAVRQYVSCKWDLFRTVNLQYFHHLAVTERPIPVEHDWNPYRYGEFAHSTDWELQAELQHEQSCPLPAKQVSSLQSPRTGPSSPSKQVATSKNAQPVSSYKSYKPLRPSPLSLAHLCPVTMPTKRSWEQVQPVKQDNTSLSHNDLVKPSVTLNDTNQATPPASSALDRLSSAADTLTATTLTQAQVSSAGIPRGYQAYRLCPSLRPELITNDPNSPLNRNPLNDLPAGLNAVLPLPLDLLPAPRPEKVDELNPVRQVITYRHLGLGNHEIADKLGQVGWGIIGVKMVEEYWDFYRDSELVG
ncbi:MAG: hypothetical protein Q9170_004019 [Blastenia crenularia]